MPATFKVHTDTLGRLSACMKHAMYGITNKAMREQLPAELAGIQEGDIVFISERKISDNALFGPFYVVNNRPPIVARNRRDSWVEIDTGRTPPEEIAYWVEFENRSWCILFDKTLSDRVSIVWPYNWRKLRLRLPSWGAVSGNDSKKLIDFAIKNEIEAKTFFQKHGIW